MKKIVAALVLALIAVQSASADHQPYERYQSIVDRQMFGQPPPGFDPTVPASSVSRSDQKELTKEQEVLKSAIHFSAINVTPDGETAVGFTDNADPKIPVHYYLKVGEVRNGWKVVEADAIKATMTIEKNDVQVALSLGANSAKGDNTKAKGGVAKGGMTAGRRAGILASRRGASAAGEAKATPSLGGSLRERRAAREAERRAEAEKEKAEREAEREEQRRELQALRDELKAQREAAEAEREAREAERAARAAQESQNGADANAENNL